MKKFSRMAIIIFIGILFLAIFSFGFGNDFFWHIKAGEYIVTNLKIPYYDIFSWYGISNNLYWFSHEWLSEVVLYLYKIVFKDFGAIFFAVSMYIVLIVLLAIIHKNKISKNIFFTVIWSLLGMLVFSEVMLPRPHMISYILLVITLYCLFDNYNNKHSKKIYILPFISLLWSNFHGGSSNLVYILCIIFLIVGLFQFNFGKIMADRISKKQIIRYLIVAILSFLVLAINPHGVKIWAYPYQNMGDTLMISSILEWASPSLNNASNYIDFLILGFVIITMIISKYKIKLIDFIILGFFLVLGFKSVRFIPLLYIASTFIIFNFVDEYVVSDNRIAIVLIVIMLLISGGFLSTKLKSNYKIEQIPDNIINYIKEKNPQRLFNFYDYGGYLIYKDIKVFIDGRADMYSNNILRDAIDLQNRGYKYLLDNYDFDMFIIPNNIALNIHLSTNDNYYVSMQEDNIVIYEKR